MSVLLLKVPPPIVALVLALLMWLTPAVAGLVQIPDPARVLCAVVLVCAGQGISIAGMVVFRRAKTTVNPVKASLASSLVIRGVYRYTRNPMYVSLTIVYVGVALMMQSLWSLLLLPLVVAFIRIKVIGREEAYMERRFGAEYLRFKNEVRRWL